MSTIGDLLLLHTTCKNPEHKYTHSHRVHLDYETYKLLEQLSDKMNNYTDEKITTSALIRSLLHFSRQALNLDTILDQEDPLCALPNTHITRSRIRDLSNVSDVLDIKPSHLTKVEDHKKGTAIWK